MIVGEGELTHNVRIVGANGVTAVTVRYTMLRPRRPVSVDLRDAGLFLGVLAALSLRLKCQILRLCA